jgi:hypothetical protein
MIYAYEMLTDQMTRDEIVIPPLDGKVHGVLFKNKDNTPIPPDEFVVFRPSDNAFHAVLPVYLAMCATHGVDPEQLAAVKHLIEKVELWRKNHPERLKYPDCSPGEIPKGW